MPTNTRFAFLFDPGPMPETDLDFSTGVLMSRLSGFCTAASKAGYFTVKLQGRIVRTGAHEFWQRAESRHPIDRESAASWKNMWVSDPHPYTVKYRAGFFLEGYLEKLDQESVDFIDWLYEHVQRKPYQGTEEFFRDYRIWLQLAEYVCGQHHIPTAPILYYQWEKALKERISDLWDSLSERVDLERALDRAAQAFAIESEKKAV